MPTFPPVALDPVVEDAVHRLAAEFAAALPAWLVRTFVVQARTELAADPPGALPELVERLARARIQELLERR
ncbi:hypothetical protein [Pseudonocardia lacus]|uniref:hypothetical protein n=1 Tax=Pseudonocardia lacus TaxID=2835865 RepID=UPI001BDDC741|nr:hypothetical protein [Pseudonocardia lacus]